MAGEEIRNRKARQTTGTAPNEVYRKNRGYWKGFKRAVAFDTGFETRLKGMTEAFQTRVIHSGSRGKKVFAMVGERMNVVCVWSMVWADFLRGKPVNGDWGCTR